MKSLLYVLLASAVVIGDDEPSFVADDSQQLQTLSRFSDAPPTGMIISVRDPVPDPPPPLDSFGDMSGFRRLGSGPGVDVDVDLKSTGLRRLRIFGGDGIRSGPEDSRLRSCSRFGCGVNRELDRGSDGRPGREARRDRREARRDRRSRDGGLFGNLLDTKIRFGRGRRDRGDSH